MIRAVEMIRWRGEFVWGVEAREAGLVRRRRNWFIEGERVFSLLMRISAMARALLFKRSQVGRNVENREKLETC